jgi:hypothetical protein
MMTSRFTVLSQHKALTPAIQHACFVLSEYLSTLSPHAKLEAVFDIDDTLIFDDARNTPNIQVKHLLEVARAYGCKIRLITAREKSPEVLKWTRDELKKHGIQYESLSLAPKKVRTSMASISAWKAAERKKFAPVALTVGDQWGDIITIENDEQIDELNELLKTLDGPWLLVEPNDGRAKYGLKLMA